MANYTEEYFTSKKRELYNEIMDYINPKVSKSSNKPLAYKTYFDEAIENYFFRELYHFGYLEQMIVGEYQAYKHLYSIETFSNFMSEIRLDYMQGNILYRVNHFAETSIQNNVKIAKNRLIQFLEREDLKDITNNLEKFSEDEPKEKELDFHIKSSIALNFKELLKESLIEIDEEKEIDTIIKSTFEKNSQKIQDLEYISNLIIQDEVLNRIKNELEKIHQTEEISIHPKAAIENAKDNYEIEEVEVDIDKWQDVILQLHSFDIINVPKGLNKISVAKNPPIISPIEWKGTQAQLGALFVELHDKGWIDLIDRHYSVDKDIVETIKHLFNVKTKIEQIFKPTPDKNEATWDLIKKGKKELWKQFDGINTNPNKKDT